MKSEKGAMKKVRETLAFFYPQVWKQYKGYFAAGVGKLLLDAAQPFVSMLVLPFLIDGLINGEKVSRLLMYYRAGRKSVKSCRLRAGSHHGKV